MSPVDAERQSNNVKIHFFLNSLFHRNSIPPTTTVENLLEKQKATTGKICVDVGFWGGIIPGNDKELPKLIKQGVVGFKCFLCPSGVDEFPNVTEEDVELAFKQLEHLNALIAVRCLIISLRRNIHSILIFLPLTVPRRKM